MADPYNLGTEIRELKIGSTFYDNETAFHALRYDFKPASVVSGSQDATLEIGANNQVTVTHVSSQGAPPTVFKGSRRPYRKECVLIIDKTTGVVTLERLSTNIQLKKTRLQGNKQVNRINNVRKLPNSVTENLSPKKNGVDVANTRSVQKETFSPLDTTKTNPNKTPPQQSPISQNSNNLKAADISPMSCLPTSEDSKGNSSYDNPRDSPDSSSLQGDESKGDESSHASDSDSDSDSSGTSSEQSTSCNNISGTNNEIGNTSTVNMSNPFLNKDLQLSESGSDTE